MDILKNIKNIFSTKSTNNKKFYNTNTKMFGFGEHFSYKKFSIDDIIKEGYLSNEDVYSVINYISKLAGNMDYVLKIKDKKTGLLKTVDSNDDLYKLFNRPNQQQTMTDYFTSLYINYLLTGSVYQYKNKIVGFNIPKSLHIIPTQDVKPFKYSDKPFAEVEGYEITFGNKTYDYTVEEIIETIMYNPTECLNGLSPLQAGRLTVKTSNIIHNSEYNMIKNNGASGIITSESETYKLTEEEQELIDDTFKNRSGGADNFNKILTLGNKVNYTPIGRTPAELDLSNNDMNKLRKICNIFGISSQLFNDPNNKTYNNLNEAKKSLYVEVLIPLAYKMIESFNKFIINDINNNNIEYVLTLDTSTIEVLQEDKKVLNESNKILTENILNVVNSVYNGIISKESGKQLLLYTLGISNEEVDKIINGINIQSL